VGDKTKVVSIEELLALASSGAKIETQKSEQILATIKEADPGPMVIEKFEDLLAVLSKIGSSDELTNKVGEMAQAITLLVKSNEKMAAAEIEKSRTQLEVLATLQSLIKSGNISKAQKIDLMPLKTVLADIKNPVVRPSYVATVNRNKRTGFIEQITLDPQTNTN